MSPLNPEPSLHQRKFQCVAYVPVRESGVPNAAMNAACVHRVSPTCMFEMSWMLMNHPSLKGSGLVTGLHVGGVVTPLPSGHRRKVYLPPNLRVLLIKLSVRSPLVPT